MNKIIIPGELPGMNEITGSSSAGWQGYAKIKKQYTELVAWNAKTQIKNKLKYIDIDITWVCKNKRRDKDNISAGVKFILDGLVEASIIENDGWKQINNIYHHFRVDKNNPSVIVKLTEVK